MGFCGTVRLRFRPAYPAAGQLQFHTALRLNIDTWFLMQFFIFALLLFLFRNILFLLPVQTEFLLAFGVFGGL